MKIWTNSDLPSKLNNAFLFLDTNSFVTALNYEEFGKILFDLKESSCSLLTIPSVVFEFTRGSDSIDSYNKRLRFLESLADIYPIEKSLNDMRNYVVALQKISGGAEYTDFLLGLCTAKFSSAYILTENHKHFKTSIYDRVAVITLDTDDQIRNHGVYSINKTKLEMAAKNILEK